MHLFDHFQPAWTARTPRPNGSSDPHRSQHAAASGLRGWPQLCPETSESAPRPAGRPAAKRADHPPPTAAPSALALWRPCPAGNQGGGAGGRDAATTSRSAPRGPGPIPPAPSARSLWHFCTGRPSGPGRPGRQRPGQQGRGDDLPHRRERERPAEERVHACRRRRRDRVTRRTGPRTRAAATERQSVRVTP